MKRCVSIFSLFLLCEDARSRVVMMLRGCAHNSDLRTSGHDALLPRHFAATKKERLGVQSVGHVCIALLAHRVLERAAAVFLCAFPHRDTMRACYYVPKARHRTRRLCKTIYPTCCRSPLLVRRAKGSSCCGILGRIACIHSASNEVLSVFFSVLRRGEA